MSHDVNKVVSLQLLVELNNLSSSSPTQSENVQHQLTDELLSALNCVFHTCLHAALDIVDKDQVTLYQCPAGRSLYQVKGTTGVPYNVLTTSLYCTCPSFNFTVLKKQSSIVCKHILAMYIAKATSRLYKVMLTDEEFTERLMFDTGIDCS